MNELKLIIKGLITIFLSIFIVWIFGSYLNWDITWITMVGDWNNSDRTGLLLVTIMVMIVITPIIFLKNIEKL